MLINNKCETYNDANYLLYFYHFITINNVNLIFKLYKYDVYYNDDYDDYYYVYICHIYDRNLCGCL